ncbi:MAG: hypothetical protein MUF78_04705 [Candidatus Edwardsbacteria bacterium]|jgi:hypothetical protein|nr:hypothetical protein [Candidatus Edwardsbacteria bacterium]
MTKPALVLIALSALAAGAAARPFVDLEAGAVFSGYNDVAVPGDAGTRFSLSRQLRSDPAPFGRLRAGYCFGGRHTVSALAAPLRISASGSSDRDIVYLGQTFPAGIALTSRYRFDSYRLTYRWDPLRRERLTAGFGFTAKIRDAAIGLEGGGLRAEKKNTGFVPIVNFRVAWRPAERLTALFEGDALAAPQGRAEDVFAGAAYRLGRRVSLKAGYRLLEGGADNDEVYTFSLFHYAVLGAVVDL